MDVGDFFARLNAPDARVQVTPMLEGQGVGLGPWNRDGHFLVRAIYDEPLEVRIQATSVAGTREEDIAPPLEADIDEDLKYTNEAVIQLGDGIWDITYWVAGVRWGTLKQVHIDQTPPEVRNIDLVGDASEGAYTLGAAATVDSDAIITIYRQGSDAPIANTLPHTVSGLRDGVHAFEIVAEDPAGNRNVYTVQVRAGNAKELPQGEHTAGIVARYTNTLRIWDISDPSKYVSPAAARQMAATEEGGPYTGSGFGITPNDPAVQQIIAEEVSPGMTTLDVAMALYIRLFDDFEYDEARLEENGLLTPAETIQNGGGVCRDLAALYVSLLRGAGVPARLVTGYLGGDDPLGFHAWVDVYAPSDIPGQSPWLPVDVSPIDGRWDAATGSEGLTVGEQAMLQSFGVKNPEYLQLRTLTAAAEIDGWSTALSYATAYNAGSAPTVDFAVEVENNFDPQTRTLCVDAETYARKVNHECGGFSHVFPNHPYLVEQVIDYGLEVTAGRGADIDVEAAYPFTDDIVPDDVVFVAYGPARWRGWDDLNAGDDDGKIRVEFKG